MIWNNVWTDVFPGIRVFAQQLKLALIAAHDCILNACIKQTRDANCHRQPTPFAIGDIVYMSTKHFTYPKEFPHKLIPKYEGPYQITEDFCNNSFQVVISKNMKQ
ncbi:hypothetical protein J132_00087 [Termitomyces sp. J132]|nr:hypothetical protein J132_00087 [Termitomyces sp. J132]